jgi:hypothetical protein
MLTGGASANLGHTATDFPHAAGNIVGKTYDDRGYLDMSVDPTQANIDRLREVNRSDPERAFQEISANTRNATLGDAHGDWKMEVDPLNQFERMRSGWRNKKRKTLGAPGQTLYEKTMGGLIKDVGNVIDKLTTTDEERLAAKQKIQELLEKADQDAQTQISERWKLDMQSDSFLSKNIRPLVLIYLTVIFTALAFFDGNIGGFKVAEEYIPIFQSLLITVYGAYFVGRTWEKSKKSKQE